MRVSRIHYSDGILSEEIDKSAEKILEPLDPDDRRRGFIQYGARAGPPREACWISAAVIGLGASGSFPAGLDECEAPQGDPPDVVL